MTSEEAIKILKEIEYPVNGDNKECRDMAFNMAIEALKDRPHGEWLNIEDTYCVCSNCRWENEHWQTRFVACPCCGADMRKKDGDD